METAFVALSYLATFGGLGALVLVMMRKARALASSLPPEDRPWT